MKIGKDKGENKKIQTKGERERGKQNCLNKSTNLCKSKRVPCQFLHASDALLPAPSIHRPSVGSSGSIRWNWVTFRLRRSALQPDTYGGFLLDGGPCGLRLLSVWLAACLTVGAWAGCVVFRLSETTLGWSISVVRRVMCVMVGLRWLVFGFLRFLFTLDGIAVVGLRTISNIYTIRSSYCLHNLSSNNLESLSLQSTVPMVEIYKKKSEERIPPNPHWSRFGYRSGSSQDSCIMSESSSKQKFHKLSVGCLVPSFRKKNKTKKKHRVGFLNEQNGGFSFVFFQNDVIRD